MCKFLNSHSVLDKPNDGIEAGSLQVKAETAIFPTFEKPFQPPNIPIIR